MSINHYVGTDGPTIKVESISEVYQTLDAMHTQVMYNFAEDDHQKAVLTKLEQFMQELDSEFPDQIEHM